MIFSNALGLNALGLVAEINRERPPALFVWSECVTLTWLDWGLKVAVFSHARSKPSWKNLALNLPQCRFNAHALRFNAHALVNLHSG
jgi:hypothetical protein